MCARPRLFVCRACACVPVHACACVDAKQASVCAGGNRELKEQEERLIKEKAAMMEKMERQQAELENRLKEQIKETQELAKRKEREVTEMRCVVCRGAGDDRSRGSAGARCH